MIKESYYYCYSASTPYQLLVGFGRIPKPVLETSLRGYATGDDSLQC